jgi:hypothetical protein
MVSSGQVEAALDHADVSRAAARRALLALVAGEGRGYHDAFGVFGATPP